MTTPSISARNLVHDFRIPDAKSYFTVLNITSLDIAAGERIAVMGPSGSGKTTLLNIIAGLLSPTRGEISVNGIKLNALSERERDRLRASTIGYVFQAFNLLQAFTALENVMLAMDLAHTIPSAQRRNRAIMLLDELGLGKRAHHRPSQLSIGEQQRVAVARALANDPQILLADEPTASVDPKTRAVVFEHLLAQVKDKQRILVVATHDTTLLQHFDRCISQYPDNKSENV
jgi:putative ABC transport system ATP-binding protein